MIQHLEDLQTLCEREGSISCHCAISKNAYRPGTTIGANAPHQRPPARQDQTSFVICASFKPRKAVFKDCVCNTKEMLSKATEENQKDVAGCVTDTPKIRDFLFSQLVRCSWYGKGGNQRR